jgi:DNA-binding beta-propeller fold protein YncE
MRKILGVCLVFSLAVPVVSSADAPPAFLLMWGSEGTGIGQFLSQDLRYLALDQSENVYVSSRGGSPVVHNRIQIFDSDGRFVRQFQTDSQFDTLTGIVVDSQGDIIVNNEDCYRVERYDNQGNFLRMWGWGVKDGSATLQSCTSSCQCGISGSGDGQLSGPWGLGLDADGNVYVVDRAASRITKYDGLGNFIRTWGWGVQDGTNAFQVCTSGCQAGITGAGNGQFDLPTGIVVLDETVCVSEWDNNRLQFFSRDGAFQSKFNVGYSAAGVSVSPNGEIYVARFWGDEVLEFDISGTQLASWGVSGSGIGEFTRPFGVAVAPSGDVFVVDQENSRVQKFGPALRSFKAGLPDRTKPLIAFPE